MDMKISYDIDHKLYKLTIVSSGEVKEVFSESPTQLEEYALTIKGKLATADIVNNRLQKALKYAAL